MEQYFESVCHYDGQTMAEVARKAAKRGLRILCYALMALLLVLAVFLIVREGLDFSTGLYVAVALLVGMAAVCSPQWAANRAVKRYFKLYGCVPEVHVSFDEEQIHVHNLQSKAENNISYDLIKRAVETRHLYLIILEEQMAVLVNKEGFTTGAPEDFIKFLRQKCPEKVRF